MSGSDELARKRLANGNACQTRVRSDGDTPVGNGINNTGQRHEITRNNHVKVFKAREALTTKLVEGDHHFQAIYDAVMVQVILFITYQFIRYSYDKGYPYFDLSMLFVGLGSLHTIAILLCVEACLLSCAFLVHPGFQLWKSLRGTLPHQLVDMSFALLYAGYVAGTLAMVTWAVFRVPFPAYSSIVATIEQLRLSMKSYSFVRENAYKVLYPWHKEDSSGPAVWYKGQMDPKVGSFPQYLYFLFAPTLLYRDHYPRKSGNWKHAIVYFLQFITTIWYACAVFKDFLFPKSFLYEDLLQCFLTSLLCAFLILILMHTCVLHAYQNFACEVMGFADKEFYSDWWASTSFSMYYRKWNLLVHDWIYAYLYVDMKSRFRSSLLAMFATTLVSALFHEYILAMALGFASPVLLLEFAGLGTLFYLIKPCRTPRVSNLFVLWALSVGGCNLLFYYQAEFAARVYCPKEHNWTDFFVPRMFECYSQVNS